MASSTAEQPNIDWIIIAPDLDDALPNRLAIRPNHLKNLGPKVEAGLFSFGGAMLHHPEVPGQTPAFCGSVMLAHAPSREAVLDLIKADVYAAGDVWDMSKLQIFPFKTFLMKPKSS